MKRYKVIYDIVTTDKFVEHHLFTDKIITQENGPNEMEVEVSAENEDEALTKARITLVRNMNILVDVPNESKKLSYTLLKYKYEQTGIEELYDYQDVPILKSIEELNPKQFLKVLLDK